MNTEVVIVAAKRNAVLRTRQAPVIWRSMIVFFDASLKLIGGECGLNDWLCDNPEWEVKNLSFDPTGNRWMLLAQRPCA